MKTDVNLYVLMEIVHGFEDKYTCEENRLGCTKKV